jgi:hypothetical protein
LHIKPAFYIKGYFRTKLTAIRWFPNKSFNRFFDRHINQSAHILSSRRQTNLMFATYLQSVNQLTASCPAEANQLTDCCREEEEASLIQNHVPIFTGRQDIGSNFMQIYIFDK